MSNKESKYKQKVMKRFIHFMQIHVKYFRCGEEEAKGTDSCKKNIQSAYRGEPC